MLVDPEKIRAEREQASPAATVIALDVARENNAHLALEARLNCDQCDDDGYRPTGLVCDHVNRTNVGRAQRDHIRKMLTKGGGA